MLSTNNYPYKSWQVYFPDHNIQLSKLHIHKSWKSIFLQDDIKEELECIDEFFSSNFKKYYDWLQVFPYPKLVFSSFNMTPVDKVKVVILGQDPYFSFEKVNNNIVPQAMGLSFSVPKECKIPSSLKNIYKNLCKYKHIDNIPTHGNLSSWANQGCLLLNTSLTVQEGSENKNGHANYWKKITDRIIKYISNNKNNVVFVLWGAPALKKIKLIDSNKHRIIVSSHPSGLSCNRNLRQYPSFMNYDHFGEINKYLQLHNKSKIVWKIQNT